MPQIRAKFIRVCWRTHSSVDNRIGGPFEVLVLMPEGTVNKSFLRSTREEAHELAIDLALKHRTYMEDVTTI